MNKRNRAKKAAWAEGWGGRIGRTIERLGYVTQKEFAGAVGVDSSRVSDWVNGKVTPLVVPALRVDDSLPLAVTLTDEHGTVLTDRSVTFQASHPAHFSVSSTGLVRGRRFLAGGGHIIVRAEQQTAVVGVTQIRGWQLEQFDGPPGGYDSAVMTLAAEPEGPTGSQGGAAARLTVACLGGTSRALYLYLTTGGLPAASGAVRYQFRGANLVPETWDQSSPGQSPTLVYPGGLLETTRFAERFTNTEDVRFAFDLTTGGSAAPLFVPRGTGPALAAVLAACPLRPGAVPPAP